MHQFTKRTVTIQPQAHDCMLKENVSFEELLETLNEWESGDISCSNANEGGVLAAYPSLEDEQCIPTLQTREKDFASRRVYVTFTTSFQKQAKKMTKRATIHWVCVGPTLSDLRGVEVE